MTRYFTLFGLQPHRTKRFNLSTDPFVVEKLRDSVVLCLNPPDKVLVLFVDNESHVHAFERTQPVLPIGHGSVEGVTHDYYRHRTNTLFAALDIRGELRELILQARRNGFETNTSSGFFTTGARRE